MELTDSAILDIRRNHFSGNQLQLALEPPSDDWHAWMLELREQHPWSPGFHDWWQKRTRDTQPPARNVRYTRLES